ncbi:tetratricopeptide repeat protein [Spongiactinospora rosea]|uniref:tetratricopeptide repeat protein n=1 Tax=Spongiactinospora rosea TaxID=2248750 RepID=UPI001314DF9E|nr:tetratricopeptide repeat protein [Spongiactinospora rosea]
MVDRGAWDRRTLLLGAAALTGAAATAPLLGGTATAYVRSGDADALFEAGEFERAGRAYERILRKDPANMHAARRRGHVALLSNRFPEAEKYLTTALNLAPDDKRTNRLLADCYTRQDKFPLAVPRWHAAGEESYAEQFAAIQGTPYQIHGDTARVPWQQTDPFPLVEASINGGPPKKFSFYTHVDALGLSAKLAKEAGLKAVAKQRIDAFGDVIWLYYGVLDSFHLGGIELRNIPVGWSERESGGEVAPDAHDGMIGTWVFYHFLTTFDYAGRSLILRRRTPETAQRARADAARAGARPLPLWLAGGHLLFTEGSVTDVAGSKAGVVSLNLGGTGEQVAGISEETAKRLGVRVDYDRPFASFAAGRPVEGYPCYPRELRLGGVTAKSLYSYAGGKDTLGDEGFHKVAGFDHAFHKPNNITLDFTDMNAYVARGKAA